MKTMPAVAAASLALAASAALALSLDADAAQSRRIAPGSHWWINDSTCLIHGNWGSPETAVTTLWIELMAGAAYRFDITDTDWRDVPADAPIEIGFAFDGGAPGPLGEGMGYAADDGGQGFGLMLFEPALIDGLGDHRELNVYRDGTLASSLELVGAAEAVAAMKACAAVREEADAMMNAAFYDELSMNMSDAYPQEDMWDAANEVMNAAEAVTFEEAATPEP